MVVVQKLRFLNNSNIQRNISGGVLCIQSLLAECALG
jgi:hypothetical protein